MSRSAEDQLLLEQRIQAMKLKNEELRRRHLEVEADKQTAAKQNALVKMNVPLDDDWVPGRHDDNPRQDRSNQQNDAFATSHERSDDRGQHFDKRNRNDVHRDDKYSYNRHHEEASPGTWQNSQNSSGRRNDYQSNRYKSDEDRHQHSEGRPSGDWSGRAGDGTGGRSKEWGSYSNRGFRGNAPSGDGSRGQPSTFTSKVFKNSSMDADRGKRSSYRLAEGDGPPPDPSYSFLGDSMRDSNEFSEKRRTQPNRRGFSRGRGRGGQPWNNRPFHHDSRNESFEGHSEAQPKHHDDPRHQSYEAAWRRERNIIDQERINRQKTSDGNWSREWDNDKVFQDEKPQRWRKEKQTHNYERSHNRKSFEGDEGHSPNKRNHSTNNSSRPNTSAHDLEQDESKNKFIRRGRFSNQKRVKEYSNGSPQQAAFDDGVCGEDKGAAGSESHAQPVEQLQVSVVSDASGTAKRCVEDVGGNLCISLSADGESPGDKTAETRRFRKGVRKAKRNRMQSTTSTGTTGTAEEDDASWEDMSSDEDVSVLTELQKTARHGTKCADVSSGPESLDPIPASGKEDEFLWDDFHPAGFQDNATLDMDAEVAYQALLDEKAKQEVLLENNVEDGSQPPKVSFRLDTACLEDSGDEMGGTKLDPLLVTTQIVQAEVDCMSLTSIPTDTSLPEEVSLPSKANTFKDEEIPEEEVTSLVPPCVSAEELSGPVSILDFPHSTSSTGVSDANEATSETLSSKDSNNADSQGMVLKEVGEAVCEDEGSGSSYSGGETLQVVQSIEGGDETNQKDYSSSNAHDSKCVSESATPTGGEGGIEPNLVNEKLEPKIGVCEVDSRIEKENEGQPKCVDENVAGDKHPVKVSTD